MRVQSKVEQHKRLHCKSAKVRTAQVTAFITPSRTAFECAFNNMFFQMTSCRAIVRGGCNMSAAARRGKTGCASKAHTHSHVPKAPALAE